MGHNPIAPPKRPTGESFHLATARREYIEGRITVEQFERCVEIVLRGGTLPQNAVNDYQVFR